MKSLIIGMGIGELYREVLRDLGHEVVTVDNTRPADFKSVGIALDVHPRFEPGDLAESRIINGS